MSTTQLTAGSTVRYIGAGQRWTVDHVVGPTHVLIRAATGETRTALIELLVEETAQ